MKVLARSCITLMSFAFALSAAANLALISLIELDVRGALIGHLQFLAKLEYDLLMVLGRSATNDLGWSESWNPFRSAATVLSLSFSLLGVLLIEVFRRMVGSNNVSGAIKTEASLFSLEWFLSSSSSTVLASLPLTLLLEPSTVWLCWSACIAIYLQVHLICLPIARWKRLISLFVVFCLGGFCATELGTRYYQLGNQGTEHQHASTELSLASALYGAGTFECPAAEVAAAVLRTNPVWKVRANEPIVYRQNDLEPTPPLQQMGDIRSSPVFVHIESEEVVSSCRSSIERALYSEDADALSQSAAMVMLAAMEASLIAWATFSEQFMMVMAGIIMVLLLMLMLVNYRAIRATVIIALVMVLSTYVITILTQ